MFEWSFQRHSNWLVKKFQPIRALKTRITLFYAANLLIGLRPVFLGISFFLKAEISTDLDLNLMARTGFEI